VGIRKIIPNWIVNTFWHWPIGIMAAGLYGFPAKKLTLIGVTGTDGKTTTVYLVNHILKTAGKKTVMISSVAAEICEKQSSTGFHVTSPHPFEVQKYLKEAVDRGVEYAVLEVTSHAMEQHRFAGCKFKLAVLTNIRPDHLDYHKTFNNYFKAKVKLLKGAEAAIINKDDKSYKQLAHLIGRSDAIYGIINRINSINNVINHITTNIIAYSIKNGADITPSLSLPGDYNLSNILASTKVALELKIDRKTIRNAIKSFTGVPGRFEEIKTGRDFRIIIDFAHTPYALEGLLSELKQQLKGKGRIISVFGCAAERGKDRRKMGKVSAQLADLTIITAEDPRFEGVEKISEEIAGWARRGGGIEKSIYDLPASPAGGRFTIYDHRKKKHFFVRIPNRQEAIDFAIKAAKKGDIVVLCGKGHEQSMNIEGVEYPWDERKAIKKALGLRQK
jgi:UDP-N-acetylmuramoyl-L-alanyl-D-glutamate--2,6-diaminopimelate ligase